MAGKRWRDYRVGDYRLRQLKGEGCAVWWEGGKRHRFRLGESEEIAARSALDAFARSRTRLQSLNRETVGDLWRAYYADREADGKKMAAFRDNWRALALRFERLSPSHVDAEVCRAYARERFDQGRKQNTVWSELTRLRSCLNWATKTHRTDARWHVWVPSKPKLQKRVLSTDEAIRLLEACTTPHIRLFVILALSTAGREAAICELTWDRVDFEHRTIDLRTGVVGNPLQHVVQKGRSKVYMSDWCRAALSEAKAGAVTDFVIEWGGKPIQRPGLAFNKAVLRAGLPPDVTPHVLRHTAITWQEEDGVPMQVISRFAGHSTEAVTRNIYSKPDATVTKPAADVIEMRMRRHRR